MKTFFLLAAFLMPAIAFALPKTLTVCNPLAKTKAKMDAKDSALTLELWNQNNAGQSEHSKDSYSILSTSNVLKSDFNSDDLLMIKLLTGLKDFNDGTTMNIQKADEKAVNLMFLRFDTKQYAGILFLEGWPVPLGKTIDCK
jgi:hypothetical protein